MSAVWALDLPAGDKLVLLALADCANDEGHCWPGMRSLCAKTGKGERSLQASIKSLCASGHLTRTEVTGKGCNYVVHPRSNCAPAEIAPRRNCPPQKTTQTPAKIAGKPLRTISSEAKASSPRGKFPMPEGVDEQVWADFLTNRRRKRMPNTETAHKRLMDDLKRLAGDDWPIPRLIEYAAAKGWGGIYDPRKDEAAKPAPRFGQSAEPKPLHIVIAEREALNAMSRTA